MPSPILARADALMQRRHQKPSVSEEIPTLTDAIDPEDDIPLLIDIEESPTKTAQQGIETSSVPEAPDSANDILETAPPSAETSATFAIPDPLPPPVSPVDVAALSEELARRVTARLQAELPGIVAAVVADFLAERQREENNAAR